MCGIAGFSGAFSDEMLRNAGAQISHRGPDGSGSYRNEHGVGFFHRRLSIIDLSPSGAQPMATADGSLVIVYNGELYNYRELRDELAARGAAFRSQSDTEVILQLYLAEGEACLTRLNGIFAFALWDGRDRTLLVARDGMGVKPLYYAESSRGFAFASEIKALVELVPEARALNHIALHRYLTFLWCPGYETPLRDVLKLGPGEAMRVRAGHVERRWTWYELPFFGPAQPPVSESEAVTGVVDHLRLAVHRQLVADVPVGAFLSGGLDSSSIVAFARELAPEIRCFTIDAPGDSDGFADDLPFARRVAEHLGVPLDVVAIDAGRMAEDLERMVWQLDEPLADPAPLNVLYISQLARQHGIKVLLSGGGGDDLLAGYRRHVALSFEPYWRWLPRPLRVGLDHLTAGLDQRSTVGRRLRRLFSGAALDGDAHLAHYLRWNRETDILALYTPDFRALVGTEPVDRPLLELLERLDPRTGDLNRLLALEQRFFLTDLNLTYTDKMAMAVGVEVRVPFLDPDFVAFAARVPERLKQRGSTGKWVLKKAMEPILPAEVINRPKSGFGAPLRRWMRHELRPMLHDLLSRDSIRNRGIFDPDAIERLLRRNDSGATDGAYALLSVMSIELWCRCFCDARGATHARAALAAARS